jgi:hypothetical protein
MQERRELGAASATVILHTQNLVGRRSFECSRSPALNKIFKRSLDRLDITGGDDDPCCRGANEIGRGSIWRHDREDRPLSREVLKEFPGRYVFSARPDLGQQKQ